MEAGAHYIFNQWDRQTNQIQTNGMIELTKARDDRTRDIIAHF